MKIKLAYGKTGLDLTLPDNADVTVVEPAYVPSVPDASATLREALDAPIGSPPLRELVAAGDTVAIVFSDLTRPAPTNLMLPAILDAISHVPPEQIVLCNALGTHRAQTPSELREMLGGEIAARYRIEQNNADDQNTQVYLGETARGHPVWINRAFMEADVKILTGFIEPHIFAGFSGGPKSVMPGMAGRLTIFANHNADMIGDPRATWGVIEDNPIWDEIHEICAMTNPAFLLNVTLNRDKAITGVFAGALDPAHRAGVDFVRETAMVPIDAPFDIVVGTNSGYPMDLNLYQSVKGMSAAAEAVKPGGAIIIAAECWDGIPDHGLYAQLLREAKDPDDLMEKVYAFDPVVQDQWQVQLQARAQQKANVYVYSEKLLPVQIKAALLKPCSDIAFTVAALLARYGSDARICVMPEGPQAVPYVTNSE